METVYLHYENCKSKYQNEDKFFILPLISNYSLLQNNFVNLKDNNIIQNYWYKKMVKNSYKYPSNNDVFKMNSSDGGVKNKNWIVWIF